MSATSLCLTPRHNEAHLVMSSFIMSANYVHHGHSITMSATLCTPCPPLSCPPTTTCPQPPYVHQGCQMDCFQTKNPNFGKFWKALDWKMFIHFMAIWNIFWRFGIFYDHLVHFVFILYIIPFFGIMYQEKYGNPDVHLHHVRQLNRVRPLHMSTTSVMSFGKSRIGHLRRQSTVERRFWPSKIFAKSASVVKNSLFFSCRKRRKFSLAKNLGGM
jgi:hypothetical protein